MFAHYLLSALLLLFAFSYSMAQDPPYKVIEFKGRNDVPLNSQYDFYLRGSQCRGLLEPLSPQFVYCPPPNIIAALEVTVKDNMPDIKIKISDDLNSVDIMRQPPCKGVSPVRLKVGCAHPMIQDSSM